MRSRLTPAVLLALAILAASALAALSSRASWTAAAAPFVLAAAIVAIDFVERRRAGLRPPISFAVVLVAVSIPVACLIVFLADPAHVGWMIPILSGGAVVPLFGRREACARA